MDNIRLKLSYKAPHKSRYAELVVVYQDEALRDKSWIFRASNKVEILSYHYPAWESNTYERRHRLMIRGELQEYDMSSFEMPRGRDLRLLAEAVAELNGRKNVVDVSVSTKEDELRYIF